MVSKNKRRTPLYSGRNNSLIQSFSKTMPVGNIIHIANNQYVVCPANNQNKDCRSLKQKGNGSAFLRQKNMVLIEDGNTFLDLYFNDDSSFYILHNGQQCIIRCSNKNFADCFLSVAEEDKLLLSDNGDFSCFNFQNSPLPEIISTESIEKNTKKQKILNSPEQISNSPTHPQLIKKANEISDKNSSVSNITAIPEREKPICVCIITYSHHINQLDTVIHSLMEQTVKPDKIVIVLSDKDFRSTYAALPRTILDLLAECSFFEVKFLPFPNFSPIHNYLYVFSLYSDHIIITLEDNTVYDKRVIEKLMVAHKKYPTAVCAYQCKLIHFSEEGFLDGYSNWKILSENFDIPSHALVHTGEGGVLFPPSFRNNFVFDIEAIQTLSPFSDISWLKICELRANIKVVCIAKDEADFKTIEPEPQKPSDTATYALKNDICLAKILDSLGNTTSERILMLLKIAADNFPEK